MRYGTERPNFDSTPSPLLPICLIASALKLKYGEVYYRLKKQESPKKSAFEAIDPDEPQKVTVRNLLPEEELYILDPINL